MPHSGRYYRMKERKAMLHDWGDAWELADAGWYPERYTAAAYRYGVNYVLYAMTH